MADGFSTTEVLVLSESMPIRRIISCVHCNHMFPIPFGTLGGICDPIYSTLAGDTTCVIHSRGAGTTVKNIIITTFMENNTFNCRFGCGIHGSFNEVMVHERTCPRIGSLVDFNEDPRNLINSYTSVVNSLKCGGCTNTLRGDTFIDITNGLTYCGNCPEGANATGQGHQNRLLEELLTDVRFDCDICKVSRPLDGLKDHHPDRCLRRKMQKENPEDFEAGSKPAPAI